MNLRSLVLITLLSAFPAVAEDYTFFETKIRPVLAEQCYDCHSEKAGKSKGGLLLDARERIRKGGDTGPAVVPGNPEASMLVTAISHADPDLEMPAKKPKLSNETIADFVAWIKNGALDPREGKAINSLASPYVDLEEGRTFWAFKPPQRPAPPKVATRGWAKDELDLFVLAKQEAEGLSPSPDASPRLLLRRLHYDITGLPPSPQDFFTFMKAVKTKGLDKALVARVDALLASERYGERWGRHWLDVARYGESSGKDANWSFPYAWRYRDYVIDAFNQDLPYDRFLTEQIAGDLLPHKSNEERVRHLIATGYLAIGTKNLNEMNLFQFLSDLIDEQIDSVSRGVMASSIACARCHDHKFDPFSMKDYYALAGIFGSTKTYFGTHVAPDNQRGGDLIALPKIDGLYVNTKPMSPQRVARLKQQRADLEQEQKDGRKAAAEAFKRGEDPAEQFNLQDAIRILWSKGRIDGQLQKVDDEGEALALAMGVMDRKLIRNLRRLERGEISKPKEKVPRGFPEVFQMDYDPRMPFRQSGRKELATWLTQNDHPLTSRVMVNRIWQKLLGEGIVASMDNFGYNGERPSHPELLDHLAVEFMDQGWSIKRMIRKIVLSRTYRQTSVYDETAHLKDPENRLLWRTHKRRLDAECLRDGMLFLSGNLDTARPDGSLIGRIGDKDLAILSFDRRVPADLDGSHHRSVYLPIGRDKLPDVLDIFDFADPSTVTGKREITNVPTQALYLMNSEFVHRQAEGFAQVVLKDPSATKAQRIERAFFHCFNRNPTDSEQAYATTFFEQTKALPFEEAFTAYCQALFATSEFQTLD